MKQKKSSILRNLLLTALFAALTAAGAFIRIPTGVSSFTLQVFFTCMAGLLLGPYWGAASQLIYVLLGLLGVPIFTEGGGLMYVAKPTFGFLLGLIPMAFLIGLLSRKIQVDRTHRIGSDIRLGACCLAGLASLYAIGLPYMYFALGGAWSVGKTVVSGCLIFLPFDALKLLVASVLGVRLLPLLRDR